MRRFHQYIAVDWSSSNVPKMGKDSIWIGHANASGSRRDSVNPPTRSQAMRYISQLCREGLERGERSFIGFDFAFGLPVGGAQPHSGSPSWQTLWARLADEIVDRDDNSSNRFEVAGQMNAELGTGVPRFWGHPWQHRYANLTPKRPKDNHALVNERRQVEMHNRRAQPTWKLSGAGSVGSQALLGIARLEKLRREPTLSQEISIWPFETHFASKLDRPIVLAEIFPSIIEVPTLQGVPRDKLQVEAMALLFACAGRHDRLSELLSAPPFLHDAALAAVLREEGWIVGVGHEKLVRHLQDKAPEEVS